MNMDRLNIAIIITFVIFIAIIFIETTFMNRIVFFLANKFVPQNTDSTSYKKLVWKTFGLCILADFLANLFITTIVFINEDTDLSDFWFVCISQIVLGTNYEYINNIISSVVIIFLSAILIFIFSRLIIFRKFDATKKQKSMFSIAMAVCSAPYFTLIWFGDIINYLFIHMG